MNTFTLWDKLEIAAMVATFLLFVCLVAQLAVGWLTQWPKP